MAKGALLWRNDADAGVVTASAAFPKLPATFLQTPQLDQRWRTNDAATSAWVLCDLGASKSVDIVALLGTNLLPASTGRLRISTADATGAAGNAYDSGVVTSGLTAGFPHLVRVLTAPVSGRYVRLDLAGGGLTIFEAGRLLVGRLFRPERNFTRGFARGLRDASRVDESVGGQEWVERRVPRRGVTVRWPALSTDEAADHAQPMQIERGISQDVGILLDLESTAPGQDLIWGLPQRAPEIRHVSPGRYEMELSVVERAWQ